MCYILHKPHMVHADWELYLAAGWELSAGACCPFPSIAFAYLSETLQHCSVYVGFTSQWMLTFVTYTAKKRMAATINTLKNYSSEPEILS